MYYEKELLGKTTLVYFGGELVAYYTLFNADLRLEYMRALRNFSHLRDLHIDSIPSLAIGRLAVDKKWQNKGIGRAIIQRVTIDALKGYPNTGIRLIIVQAKKDAISFYEKLGFQFSSDTRNEQKRFRIKGTRTMFLDLSVLKDGLYSD